MKVELNKLRTVTNYARDKGLSRQHVYRLVESGDITIISVDGIAFVYLDEKTAAFDRKRSKRNSSQ